MRSALRPWMTESTAAGIRTSQGCSRMSSLLTGSPPGKSDHAAGLGHVVLELADVEAVGVPDPALDVADARDRAPVAPQQTRGHAAHVAEALHDDLLAPQLLAQALGRLVEHVDDAAPGGLAPARGAAHDDRLAGDDPGHALALGHGVGVHHPGHGLLVGAEVGGGDVEIGADHEDDLGGVAAGEVLPLARRELARVAADAALGAAVGQAHERALPAHQHGERGHLAQVDARGRSAGRPWWGRARCCGARGSR